MIKRTGWILLTILAFGVAGYAFAVGLTPDVGPQEIKSKFEAFPFPLWAHTVGGGVALILGVFQLHPGLRARYTPTHKQIGKLYLLAVLVSGSAGLYMAFISEGGVFTALGFGMLATLWLFTAVMAFLRIRQRNLEAHRSWMIRNYALTLSAVTLRFYLPFALMNGFDFLTAYMVISWMCWVPNLVIAELFFRPI